MVRYAELDGAVVLVTGAGRGIGRGVALAFGLQGATVIVNDLTAEACAGTVGMIHDSGGRAEAAAADVGDPDAGRRLVSDAIDRHRRLDVLVANAGINPVAPFMDLTQETWERIQRTNEWSLFHCGQPAARHMAERGGGSIVVIGSPACNETYIGADPLRRGQGGSPDAGLRHGLGARSARRAHQHRPSGMDRDRAQSRVPMVGAGPP